MTTFREIGIRFGEVYTRLFKNEESSRVHKACEALKLAVPFQSLPSPVLRDLARVMHYRDYRTNEIPYHEGDPGLGLYVVEYGAVTIVSSNEEGEEEEVEHLGPGGVFGESSLVGDYSRKETARVATETRLLGLFRPDLKSLLKRNPQSGTSVLLAVSNHFAAKQEYLMEQLAKHQGKVGALRSLQDADLSVRYLENVKMTA